ncbi:MAG: hypothetical protein U1A78_21205 [Polyangia bacterium]
MSTRKKARPQAADLQSTSDDAPADARPPVSEPAGDGVSEGAGEGIGEDTSGNVSAHASDRRSDRRPRAATDRAAARTASRGDSGFGGDSVGSSGFGGDSTGSNGFGGGSVGSNGFGGDSTGSNGFGGSRSAAQRPEPPEVIDRSHQLLQTLFHELFQTEQSAALHPEREARRLGTVPPADALRQVAEHARRVLVELPELASRRQLPVSRIGQMMGRMFSHARTWFADHLIQPERSYRGTLLGMRHGVDLVTLIRDSALVEGDAELAEWCARWLLEREPLVEAVAAQLQWFAETPDAALGNTAWEQAEQLLTRLGALLRQRMAATAPSPQPRPADSTVN